MAFAQKYTTAENPVEQRMLASIEAQKDKDYIAITPKQMASIMGHEAMIQAFENDNLLYRAAGNGHLDIVQALIDTKKVDLNQTMPNGATALFIAAQNGA